jgi:hypothetical protein
MLPHVSVVAKKDVVAIGGEVGDGLLGRVKFGLVPRLDGVALPRLRVADVFERALVDERRALGVHEDESAVGRGEARVKGSISIADGRRPRMGGDTGAPHLAL